MILCCGEALIDMLPENTVSGETAFLPKVGGAIFNTSIALGRLGENVGLLTGVSKDLFGERLTNELERSNVNQEYLVHFEKPSSLAFVDLKEGQATYTFYTENAADTVVTTDVLPSADHAFDALYFGGISLCTDPTASSMVTFAQAKAKDAVIMIDPNIRTSFISDETSYRFKLDQIMGCSDVIKVSDEDLNWLAGTDGNFAAQIAAMPINENALVLVTAGADGAEAFWRGNRIAKAASTRVDVVDTVGAGDTFNAGFLSYLSQHGHLSKDFFKNPDPEVITQALTFAGKVAAVTVSRKGANPPWRNELTT